MAATPSTMLELGTKAPDFKLSNIDTSNVSLAKWKGSKGTLIVFICNHCPYVIQIIDDLVSYTNKLNNHGISTIYISSNDIEKYPQDSPEKMKEFAHAYGMQSPYLFDEEQIVAKEYKAACTPDFFLFDDELKLRYRGQYDDSRPGNNIAVDGKDLKKAIENLLNGNPISDKQIPSIGCNIKWKSGNEPEYFG